MRTLTLVVEAEQPRANWIWDDHVTNRARFGIKIVAIGEGDLMCMSDHPKLDKKEMVYRVFNELMHQEVGHDWGLLDEYVKDLHIEKDLHMEMRLANVGMNWAEKKEGVLQKAEKIVECLV
jgi:hypothetical protein